MQPEQPYSRSSYTAGATTKPEQEEQQCRQGEAVQPEKQCSRRSSAAIQPSKQAYTVKINYSKSDELHTRATYTGYIHELHTRATYSDDPYIHA